MTIAETERDMIHDLEEITDPMSQLSFLIACGRELTPLPDQFRIKENLIPECQVKTWVHTEFQNKKFVFLADSEALVVRGALALFEELFTGRSEAEIRNYDSLLLQDSNFTKHYTAEQLAGLHKSIAKFSRD